MYKPFNNALIPLVFFISTLSTNASLIGIYGRFTPLPVLLWSTQGKNTLSTKNAGGNLNVSWQINRTEEVDFDMLWGSQDMNLGGTFPVPSASFKHLIPLSYNVKLYLGGGLGVNIPKFKWSNRVIMPLVTVGFIYHYTPKLCFEVFGKRYFVFEDPRLNQSSLISVNKIKGDIPVIGVRVGYYIF